MDASLLANIWAEAPASRTVADDSRMGDDTALNIRQSVASDDSMLQTVGPVPDEARRVMAEVQSRLFCVTLRRTVRGQVGTMAPTEEVTIRREWIPRVIERLRMVPNVIMARGHQPNQGFGRVYVELESELDVPDVMAREGLWSDSQQGIVALDMRMCSDRETMKYIIAREHKGPETMFFTKEDRERTRRRYRREAATEAATQPPPAAIPSPPLPPPPPPPPAYPRPAQRAARVAADEEEDEGEERLAGREGRPESEQSTPRRPIEIEDLGPEENLDFVTPAENARMPLAENLAASLGRFNRERVRAAAAAQVAPTASPAAGAPRRPRFDSGNDRVATFDRLRPFLQQEAPDTTWEVTEEEEKAGRRLQTQELNRRRNLTTAGHEERGDAITVAPLQKDPSWRRDAGSRAAALTDEQINKQVRQAVEEAMTTERLAFRENAHMMAEAMDNHKESVRKAEAARRELEEKLRRVESELEAARQAAKRQRTEADWLKQRIADEPVEAGSDKGAIERLTRRETPPHVRALRARSEGARPPRFSPTRCSTPNQWLAEAVLYSRNGSQGAGSSKPPSEVAAAAAPARRAESLPRLGQDEGPATLSKERPRSIGSFAGSQQAPGDISYRDWVFTVKYLQRHYTEEAVLEAILRSLRGEAMAVLRHVERLTVDSALEAMENRYGETRSGVANAQDFFACKMEESQTVSEFVSEIEELAEAVASANEFPMSKEVRESTKKSVFLKGLPSYYQKAMQPQNAQPENFTFGQLFTRARELETQRKKSRQQQQQQGRRVRGYRATAQVGDDSDSEGDERNEAPKSSKSNVKDKRAAKQAKKEAFEDRVATKAATLVYAGQQVQPGPTQSAVVPLAPAAAPAAALAPFEEPQQYAVEYDEAQQNILMAAAALMFGGGFGRGGFGRGRGRGGFSSGRGRGRGGGPPGGGERKKTTVVTSATRCWLCQQLGHMNYDCPQRTGRPPPPPDVIAPEHEEAYRAARGEGQAAPGQQYDPQQWAEHQAALEAVKNICAPPQPQPQQQQQPPPQQQQGNGTATV